MSQLNIVQQQTVHEMLVNDFRVGRLGRFTLDTVPRGAFGPRLEVASSGREKGEGEGGAGETVWRDTEVETRDVEEGGVAGGEHSPGARDSMRETLNELRHGNMSISRKQGPVANHRMYYKLRDRG